MANRPIENLPPWRETPLDHWSTEIDPALMAGDEWVDNSPGADPGNDAEAEARIHSGSPFLHPTIDTNYGLESDVFTSEGES